MSRIRRAVTGVVGTTVRLSSYYCLRQVDASQLDQQEQGRAKEIPCRHGGRSNVINFERASSLEDGCGAVQTVRDI